MERTRILLALLAPLVVLALGVDWIHQAGEVATSPAIASVIRRLDGSEAPLLLTGNSVADASLDASTIGEAAGIEAVKAALPGGLPPHWLALLRHQVFGAGLSPKVVLLYAPPQNLLDMDASSAADAAMLIDLGAGPDLLARAGVAVSDSGGVGPWARFERDRQRARDGLLRGLAEAPAGLLLDPPSPGGQPPVRAALERLLGERGPNATQERFDLAPDHPRGGNQPGTRAQRAPDSFLPDLLTEVQAHGARLIYVHPALRPDRRSPCPADPRDAVDRWLLDHGADVLDLTWAPLAPADFDNIHHLSPAGRAALAPMLGAEIRSLAPYAEAGRWRILGC